MAVGVDREHHEASGDHGINSGKGEDRKSDAGARLRGTVDIAPVEQATDQPLSPGFCFLRGRCPIGHC
jgi:hypothetical protein